MKKKSAHEPQFFGSATVGERGQIVIPAGARQAHDIRAGDKLLIFSGLHGNALSVMKSEQVSQFVSRAIERLTRIDELARGENEPDSEKAKPEGGKGEPGGGENKPDRREAQPGGKEAQPEGEETKSGGESIRPGGEEAKPADREEKKPDREADK